MTDRLFIRPLREVLNLGDEYIDPTVIRDLLVIRFEKAKLDFITRNDAEVWLGCQNTLNALAGEHTQVIRYHQETCAILALSADNRFSVPFTLAARVGFEPCPECNELSLPQWASNQRVDLALVQGVLDRTHGPLHYTEALTILRAIGETPHPRLLDLENRAVAA